MRGEFELVEVYDVARPRLAPVEYVGRLRRDAQGRYHISPGTMAVAVQTGDELLARPEMALGAAWRSGRTKVGADFLDIEWYRITAICEGDHVYRIGKPTTPSLEERVAMLERLVHPDLVVADDAERSGRPAIAAELRAKFPWWSDPDGDR